MPSLPRPHLLLVEDSEDDAFFFRHALKKTQIECDYFHVSDGGEALQYLEAAAAVPADPAQPRPDLVFLDLKLPTLSGFEILSALRKRPTSPPWDITVLSGSDHASDVERALSLGANGHVVKPVLVEFLQTRLQDWADRQTRAATAAPSPAAGPV